MRWQKRARIGVAIFGIAFAFAVFFAIGERTKFAPAAAPPRLDPKAVVETRGAVLQQIRGSKQDFLIEAENQLTYEGGASKLMGVRITVREKAGRDFIVSGREAVAGENQKELQITGDVKLAASDGFELRTGNATFSEDDGVVRAPGPIEFSKGRMSGSGVGMTYDRNTDVLTVADQSRVKLIGEGGSVATAFEAGTSILARRDNYLQLERAVHVLRGEQQIEADKGTATLSENDEFVTFIELRDNARVSGGSSAFQSMSARDIDLDYSEDGQILEAVTLGGSGRVVLSGRDGASGREIAGDSLNIALAPDGAVTSVVGRDTVQLVLPALEGTPRRTVSARALDAAGEAEKGMTSARFTDNVEFREEPSKGAPRVARSRSLTVGLDGDAVTSAVFTGSVKFEEEGLRASGAEARYEPAPGVLRLKGTDAGGGPRVADEQVTIDADAIDVTLEGRRMVAHGNVKTLLRSAGKDGSKMPGLLSAEQPTNVSSASLTYEGGAGKVVYSGGAQLWQGETAVRADTIVIDQAKGDLLATGGARSTLVIDDTTSIGRADEIRYDDARREVVFTSTPPSSTAAGAPGSPAPAAPFVAAQLSGPQGDLRADRIVVALQKTGSGMRQLEAYTNVDLRLDRRVATGTRLTYFAIDERYVITGAPARPVTVVEECRETTGHTLTFFKSTDRIIVDGNEEIRTQTKSGGPCPEPRSE
jgi:lipopolysaccharide export system protein LptA